MHLDWINKRNVDRRLLTKPVDIKLVYLTDNIDSVSTARAQNYRDHKRDMIIDCRYWGCVETDRLSIRVRVTHSSEINTRNGYICRHYEID